MNRKLLGLLLLATSTNTLVHAQDEKVERVEVTGSHIKRIDVEGPSPVQTLDRELLENSGYNSVSDVLRDITASSFGGTRERAGSNAAGVSTVNLRGLGSDRTLVLLDGKRLPTDPVLGAVDLNLIPMGIVDRIEILKDGASATYGSDALGGVVNIITRKNFTGTEATIRSSINKFEGGERTDASVMHGYGSSKFRAVGILNFRTNNEIKSQDRSWSDGGYSNFSAPANYDDGTLQPSANCTDIDENGLCRYKFSDYADEVPSIKQFSAMTQLEYHISPDLTAYARLIGNLSQVDWQYAPNAAIYQANHPGVGNATFYDRLEELGPRKSEGETFSFGIQTGLKGYMFDTWSWDVTYDFNQLDRETNNPSGYALEANLAPLVANGTYDPLAARGSRVNDIQAFKDAVHYEPWNKAKSSNHFIEAKASGELFTMFDRPVGAAFGTMFSYEDYTNKLDAESEAGNVLGSAGSSGGGDRTIISAYSELALNPLDSVEVQLAGRFDNYDDFGSTVNPKLGLRWQANSQLMFRASVGTGFKAPTLVELYLADALGNPTFKDEVACENQGGSYCNARQYQVRQGGNKDLKEETSLSYNVGGIYQMAQKTSFGFDAWAVNIEDVVGVVDLNKATEYERRNGLGSTAQYGVVITRNGAGLITNMEAKNQNLGTMDLQGLDLSFSHVQDTRIGDFSLKVDHSQLFKYEQETFPGLGIEDILGTNGAPKWKNNITLGYNPSFHRPSTFYLIAKTTAKNEKSDPAASDEELEQYTEFDFQYNLALVEWRAQLTFGVINLFGSTPPLDETAPNEKLNGSLYNPIGQSAYIQYTQAF